MYRKVAFGIVVVGTVGVGGVLASTKFYNRRLSVLFPGEPKSYETLYDKQFELPVTQIMPILGEGVITPVILAPVFEKIGLGSYAKKKSEKAFNRLINEYPECFLGYAGQAWLHSKTDKKKAEEYFEKSLQIAKENPRWTEPLKFLLPTRENLLHSSEIEYPSEFYSVTDNVSFFNCKKYIY